jgi:hypothetical protein
VHIIALVTRWARLCLLIVVVLFTVTPGMAVEVRAPVGHHHHHVDDTAVWSAAPDTVEEPLEWLPKNPQATEAPSVTPAAFLRRAARCAPPPGSEAPAGRSRAELQVWRA